MNLGLILQQAANVMQPSPLNNVQPLVQPDGGLMPSPPAPEAQAPHGFFRQGGMGRYIAGAIGDALLQNARMQPIFMPAQQRQQEEAAQDAQWTRREQSQLANQVALKQYDLAHPAPAPMERDLAAWQAMTPEQRAAYNDMQKARAGDPDVTVSLPNGQFYVGPKSGLAAALTGQTSAPAAPVGKLTPLTGGGVGNGTGGFLR